MTMTTDTDVTRAAPSTATGIGHVEAATRTDRRSAAIWALVLAFAIAVAALGVVAFAGDDGDVEIAPARVAVAERIEREAKLEGQARTYLPDASADGDFVDGSRRMPTS